MLLKYIKEFIFTRYQLSHLKREQLEQLQQTKLKRQLEQVTQQSPYYQPYKGSVLLDFPVMKKQHWMSHFDQINTRGLKKDLAMKLALQGEKTREFESRYQGISVGLSSGTSGHRGLYTLSKGEEALWAANALAKLLPKKKWLGNNIAFFMRANNNLYSSLNKPGLRLDYYDLEKDFKLLMKHLKKQDPNIIIAPPSVLYDIRHYFGKSPFKKIDLVISVAEVLEEQQKALLAQFFKVPFISQVYQCTEGFLAYTCPHGSFHLCEDIVYFEKEWLDKQRFIPIITDLHRAVQPVIRYRLNDILHIGEPCSCGSPLTVIEKIEGREDDAFWLFNSQGDKVKIYADFIRRLMLFVKGISRYRVTQYQNVIICEVEYEQPNECKVIDQAIQQEFNNLFEKFNVQPLQVLIYPFERGIRSQKLAQVQYRGEITYEKNED